MIRKVTRPALWGVAIIGDALQYGADICTVIVRRYR